MTDQPPFDDESRTADTFSLDDETSVSTAIVRAVSQVDDRSTNELPALHDAVDTEALETLLRTDGAAGKSSKTTVSFDYADYEVTVTTDGKLRVEPQ